MFYERVLRNHDPYNCTISVQNDEDGISLPRFARCGIYNAKDAQVGSAHDRTFVCLGISRGLAGATNALQYRIIERTEASIVPPTVFAQKSDAEFLAFQYDDALRLPAYPYVNECYLSRFIVDNIQFTTNPIELAQFLTVQGSISTTDITIGGSIKKGAATITIPDATGTLALTTQIVPHRVSAISLKSDDAPTAYSCPFGTDVYVNKHLTGPVLYGGAYAPIDYVPFSTYVKIVTPGTYQFNYWTCFRNDSIPAATVAVKFELVLADSIHSTVTVLGSQTALYCSNDAGSAFFYNGAISMNFPFQLTGTMLAERNCVFVRIIHMTNCTKLFDLSQSSLSITLLGQMDAF
jgi:hypothetical protein